MLLFLEICVKNGKKRGFDYLHLPVYTSLLGLCIPGTRCKVLVGVAWTLSAVFASPMLFLSGVSEGSQECWMALPEPHHWLVSTRSSIL